MGATFLHDSVNLSQQKAYTSAGECDPYARVKDERLVSAHFPTWAMGFHEAYASTGKRPVHNTSRARTRKHKFTKKSITYHFLRIFQHFSIDIMNVTHSDR